MTYILVDLANTFYRSRYVVRGDTNLKIGMAFHITLSSIKKAWYDFGGSHTLIALEGRSWRKDFYPPYKRNRSENRAAMTVKEREEEEAFWEAYDDLKNFFIEKTNCTVLHHPQLEADDLIAGFIQNHPESKHVIISTDTDFQQLISDNVSQYNGVLEQHITKQGFFDVKGQPIKDNKTGEFKLPLDPEWMLFLKCIRGDSTDNVFSAYPGARIKGTKNKVGLTEAFADKDQRGYNWNNFLLQRWVDADGIEHRVIDDYERNRRLIDLSYQPDHIREIINQTIKDNSIPKEISQVGIRLMKFCQAYDMRRILDNIQQFADPFQAPYN